MGILSNLFGGGTSIKDIAEPVNAVGNALDNLFTSDEERANAEIVMEKLRQKPHVLQAEISKLEASHRSSFVAGWRPALGWVCATGLLFVFVINPIIQWLTGMPGPSMPLEAMMTLVVSLLGLGGLRTFEKVKGVSK